MPPKSSKMTHLKQWFYIFSEAFSYFFLLNFIQTSVYSLSLIVIKIVLFKVVYIHFIFINVSNSSDNFNKVIFLCDKSVF